MFLNALHIRLGLIGVGVLLLTGYLLSGGSLMPGTKPVIQIEFGMYPEEFEGVEVLIDGVPAGRLARFGNAMRSGFPVKEGEHTVALDHPTLACRPARIHAQGGLGPVLLIADIRDAYRDGNSAPEIVLDR